MIDDPRRDRPQVVHRLGVALQFFDAFTLETVRAPLRVSIPALHLRALAVARDASYRVLVPEAPHPAPPAVTVDVAIEAEDGDYVSHEPIQVTLPRTASVPPPPVRRQDYLVRSPLWPSVRVRVPAGETAVLGHLVAGTPPAAAAGYKVVLHTAGENPALVPYARTDERGDFLYRLNRLRGSAPSGGAVVRTATLSVKLFTPTGAPVGSVNPASVTVDLGRVLARQFTVP